MKTKQKNGVCIMESIMLIMVLLICVYYEYKSARSSKLINDWNELYKQNQIELGCISEINRI